MLVRIPAAPASRPNTLGALGMESGSNPIVSLSEFNYKKGTEIFGEKEPGEYVYQVKVGAVRTYKLLPDGRRQIGAFHLAGDIFGVENGGAYRLSAEAILDTRVRIAKRERQFAEPPELGAFSTKELLTLLTKTIEHAENH